MSYVEREEEEAATYKLPCAIIAGTDNGAGSEGDDGALVRDEMSWLIAFNGWVREQRCN